MKLSKNDRRSCRKSSVRIMEIQQLIVTAKAEIASAASEISRETRSEINKITGG